MKSMRMFALALASMAFMGREAAAAPDGLLGFRAASSADELQREKAFDAAIDPADLRSWMEQMSSEPNQVGSPHDKANAEFTLAKFKEWGWEARIETFDVLYPTPKSLLVELVAPVEYKARLSEPAVDGDRTSSRTAGALPPYNIYCADGDVTADLVYVNYGLPADYAELERRGIDVKGRIVIARYGVCWRGLKPKLAQEHGAVGCIIYSDPHEEGYWSGDVYPKGAYRPDDGVQRGSVADITQYTGDPLTPGVGATKDAKRLKVEDAPTILKIPVIPISSADAKPLLAALEGPVAPAGWRGALPLTYHVGPGPAKVHLAIVSDWSLKPIYDVIGVMKGSQFADQWVVRGNHHDGWVFGAWDPLAGNISVMAEAKAIGALVKAGWRPLRTLVYASWDGEEPGLLGSTEWAETHADELQRKVVLYVNSDTNGRGFLFAGGSHSYQRLLNEVAGAVLDPETGATILDRWRAQVKVAGIEKRRPESIPAEDEEVMIRAANAGGDMPISALGSGSDYTPFLQHLAVASMNLGFRGEDQDGGIYHSTYDSFDHFIRFGDPKFVYEVSLAQTAGRLVLRAADAEVLPMRMGDLADSVARYVAEVEKLTETEREDTGRLNALVDEGAFKLAADPQEARVAPSVPADVPLLAFEALDRAVNRIKKSAKTYDDAFARAAAMDFKLSRDDLARLDGILQGLERSLSSERGLPGRAWYKHMLYAPGLYTGYAAKTLPGIREAIELRRWPDASDYIGLVAEVLNKASSRMDEATEALTPRYNKPTGSGKSLGPVPPPPSDS
ncbi:MAG: transferrin receptor-like dimerization domain-containing protein [Opitutaceae bacterium]|jgi:N-acetylated-alpha-linked acidic dipeptidase